MERLLVVKLDARDCEAELWLNGVPVARADAARPSVVVPVHEFTLSGANRLELVVWPSPWLPPGTELPPPIPIVADGLQSASARVLLPRLGSPMHEAAARTLAQLDWAPPAGERFEAPLRLQEDVSLPVSFPRWRWLDAPAHPVHAAPAPALHALALSLVQTLAQDLARGEADRFVTTVRLRTEELALAYQRRPEDEAARLHADLLALHAAGAASWVVPEADALLLRPVAGGRLLECLAPDGAPALRTAPDEQGQTRALPLRVAAVEGRLYVLR